jgi:hypothetical protein
MVINLCLHIYVFLILLLNIFFRVYSYGLPCKLVWIDNLSFFLLYSPFGSRKQVSLFLYCNNVG